MTSEDIKKLVNSLTRDQVNFLISAITDNLYELQVVTEQVMEQRKADPSSLQPLSSSSNVFRTKCERVARSLDEERLEGVVYTLKNYPGRFKQQLLYKLVSIAEGIIEECTAQQKTRSVIMETLTPLELLMHMHYSAMALALEHCPETPKCDVPCDECRTRRFRGFLSGEKSQESKQG